MSLASPATTVKISSYDVIIIGAGPAGLFCGIQIGRRAKLRCLIVEKNPGPGKKLLLTGGGHCNFTHTGTPRQFVSHYGENGPFLKPAIKAFSNRDLIRYFQSRGLEASTDKSGRVTPASNQASDVLGVLTRELHARAIEVQTSSPVQSISLNPEGVFVIHTDRRVYTATILVIASGGKSYPVTGSTGAGYLWAESLGHKIVKPRPALTQLFCADRTLSELSGTSLWGSRVSLWNQGKKTHTFHGDVLFTHRGISGPAVQDISRYVEKQSVLTVQLLVNTNRRDFDRKIESFWTQVESKTLRNAIKHLGLSDRLTDRLLACVNIDRKTKTSTLSKKQKNIIVDTIFDFPLIISGRAGFETAMVTQGGVALDTVCPHTMQSKLRSGLYFIGEILDIDGDCGGYNLQAAFSTGYLAARAICSS